MKTITIATWNINSVRLRIELVKKLLLEHNIDILALQETKTQDEFFPSPAFKEIGYEHLHFRGEKSYNGVAFISRLPFTLVESLSFYNNDCRHLAINLNGLILHNFYVPAGGDEPDISINPKFAHKLEYVDLMREWFLKRQAEESCLLMGDLNIAPLANDVWSHKSLLNVVSHTPVETDKLNRLMNDNNFVDLARKFVPENEKLYSWWSYRNKDWEKSNRGRRLDHIWASKNIENNIKSIRVLKEARNWPTPSDHVPVIAEIIMR
jgi:exodeoxyribonuclease-3